MKHLFKLCISFSALLLSTNVYAVDSYRYMHVTIETPWLIFMGLLVVFMSPFILMAVLHWHFAFRAKKEPSKEAGE